MRGVLEINLGVLADNIRKIRAFLPENFSYFSVIKSDAYGLGLQEIAHFIDQKLSAYVQGFAVANVREASEVRLAGSKLPTLVLSPIVQGDIEELWQTEAIPVVSSREEIDWLEKSATKKNAKKSIHIAIDTGMGRAGVWYSEAKAFLEYVRSTGKHLQITGFATHYSSIQSDPALTVEQHARFLNVIPKKLGKSVLLHSSSSFGIEDFIRGTNAVRIGALQYGYPESDPLVKKLKLRPVTSLKAFIILVKSLPCGVRVGYDGTYQLKRDTKIALLSIGCWDGISRNLPSPVLIHGHRCPIIGTISLDTITVDVTDIPEVSVGDEAVFWGTQNSETITLDEFSQPPNWDHRLCACYLSNRIGREYVE